MQTARQTIRHRVDPRCIPIEKAARLLGMAEAEFQQALPDLYARNFPKPIPVVGNWDIAAINKWLDSHMENGVICARDARDVVAGRLEELKRGTR